MPADPVHRRRRALSFALPVVLVLGLAVRFGLGGWPADAAGGVAYTALVYVLIAVAFPDRPPVAIGLAALTFSVVIELFQLTPIPQSMADAFGPSRLLFGTSFNAADLPPYLAGALAATWLDQRFGRPHTKPPPARARPS